MVDFLKKVFGKVDVFPHWKTVAGAVLQVGVSIMWSQGKIPTELYTTISGWISGYFGVTLAMKGVRRMIG